MLSASCGETATTGGCSTAVLTSSRSHRRTESQRIRRSLSARLTEYRLHVADFLQAVDVRAHEPLHGLVCPASVHLNFEVLDDCRGLGIQPQRVIFGCNREEFRRFA